MRVEKRKREIAVISDDGPLDALTEEAVRALVANQAVATTVGTALASLPRLPSPQVLQSLRRREERFRSIEERYGMLTAAQIARAGRSASSNTAQYVNNLAKRFALVYEARGRTRYYPGFQFAEDGQPRPEVSTVVSALRDAGWSNHSMITWLTTPNTYLDIGHDGQVPPSPIDALPQRLDQVLYAARQTERV